MSGRADTAPASGPAGSASLVYDAAAVTSEEGKPMRTMHLLCAAALAFGLSTVGSVRASESPAATEPPATMAASAYDAEHARRLGADERGMRRYVLVVLKTGPTRVPEGEARTAMFAGHFANMERLAKEGKLAVAGPFMPNDTGWRGLFVFAVESVEEARALAETDPVIVNGEMVAEYHPWYGSAALMAVNGLHERLVPPAGTKAD
jgi:uncharacterized protein YciI